jgi:hypothetical protein
MFVTIRLNTIEHVDADCNCASSQNVSFINKTSDAKKNGMSTEKYRDNVISITAAIKSAEKVSVQKVCNVKFIYPMLECI